MSLKNKIILLLLLFAMFFLSISILGCGTAPTQVDVNGIDEIVWPEAGKAITFIVPFSAGGGVDGFARNLAIFWEKELGVPVIVENYPGAAGLLGATKFFQAKPDGYTLFIGIQPSYSFNIVTQDANFALDDLAVINLEQIDPAGILVGNESPYESIYELVEDMKSGAMLSIGDCPGTGTGVLTIVFLEKLGLEANIVRFEGGGELRTAVMGGHVDFGTSSSYGDLSVSEFARVLSTTYPTVFDLWPEAVPMNEVFDYYGASNIPIIGDARMVTVHAKLKTEQPEIYQLIVETYERIYKSTEYQEKMKELGTDKISQFRTPEEAHEIFMGLHELILEYEDRF